VHSLSGSERWGVFETLVYVAWSDDRLAAAEVSSARAVAEELDLGDEPREPGALLREGRRCLRGLDLDGLSEPARHVAYATAVWTALADDVEHPAELATLRMLRQRLGLDEIEAALLEACARLAHASGAAVGPRTAYRALLRSVADVMVGADDRDVGRLLDVSPPLERR